MKPDANREEVESLQNLITRLDFNSYYASAQISISPAAFSASLRK